ncbi:hypothetical protein Nepgr_032911 [Nepenthes gracilis]|uniref:Protein TIFY n=1 Tax=Nepenthes gracilis TaxID=150966 RepID=A0AAD3TJJ0_NEPGR|nr:hypothetical protein Nepgr_032911 [Nepenthes gracilis]
MRRNCNLELQLLPSSFSSDAAAASSIISGHPMGSNCDHDQSGEQQMTIFYNGRVCVCDVTEIQARAIIWMASREVDKERRASSTPATPSSAHLPPPTPPAAPATLSMKRSLQRFLQKRNYRIQAAAPYHH